MAKITRWCNACGKRVPLDRFNQKGVGTQRKCDDCIQAKVVGTKTRWQ